MFALGVTKTDKCNSSEQRSLHPPPPLRAGPGLARGAPALPRDPAHTDISNQARRNPIQGRSMPPTQAAPRAEWKRENHSKAVVGDPADSHHRQLLYGGQGAHNRLHPQLAEWSFCSATGPRQIQTSPKQFYGGEMGRISTFSSAGEKKGWQKRYGDGGGEMDIFVFMCQIFSIRRCALEAF